MALTLNFKNNEEETLIWDVAFIVGDRTNFPMITSHHQMEALSAISWRTGNNGLSSPMTYTYASLYIHIVEVNISKYK